MRRLLVTAALAVALAAAVAGCGLGGDSELQSIDADDLVGLDETSTTTTTTTAPASEPAVATTVPASSTTIATESVELYFVDGTRLQPVRIDLAGTATPNRVIEALLEGRPAGDIGIGLRTMLPRDLVNSVVPTGAGDALVDLAAEPFSRIDPADQRTAVAQIVMTLVNRPGIGQVRFTLDGEPQRVPRRDGLQSEPGEGVFYNDYVSLLDAVDAVTTTSAATTTEPALTAPPSTPAPAGP